MREATRLHLLSTSRDYRFQSDTRLLRSPSMRPAITVRLTSFIQLDLRRDLQPKAHFLHANICSWGLFVDGMAEIQQIVTPSFFPPRLVFGLLLVFFALQSNASPATLRIPSSLVMVNSSLDEVITHCYTPEGADTPGIQPTNLQACEDALTVLVLAPQFTTPFRFSRNPRAMAREVPAGWQYGEVAECRIIVNCENDHDSAVFTLARVAHMARRIIDHCVDAPDPRDKSRKLEWGGVDSIKDAHTFYVAVARPIRSVLEVEGPNGTIVTGWGVLGDSIGFS